MSNVNFQLHCDDFGRLVLTDAEGQRHEGVAPVRAFPIAAPDEGLSLINFEGHEVGWVDRVADLPPAIRDIVEADLRSREFVPEVERIVSVSSFRLPEHLAGADQTAARPSWSSRARKTSAACRRSAC